MSKLYASKQIYDSFSKPLVQPLTSATTESQTYMAYGTTDKQTSIVNLYSAATDSWGNDEVLTSSKVPSLYDVSTNKYYSTSRIVSGYNKWFSLNDLLNASSSAANPIRLSPSNTISVKQLYSNSDGVVARMFQYNDPYDHTMKYLINLDDLLTYVGNKTYFKWLTEAEIRSQLSDWFSFDNERAQPIHFVNEGELTATVALKKVGSLTTSYEYSYNGTSWSSYTLGTSISLNKDDSVYFRGTKSISSSDNYIQFELSNDSKIACYGNALSLLSTSFAEISDLTPFGNYTLKDLFSNCASLTRSPMIPATKLSQFCYTGMFRNCTSLESISQLPATDLAQGCYWSMFVGCTTLASAPELPAKTLASSCYYQMFYGCTSLTDSPKLISETLVSQCYYRMFYNCENLRSVYCYALVKDSSDTIDWLNGESSAKTPGSYTGSFYSASLDIWSSGNSEIPVRWSNYLARPICFELASDETADDLISLNSYGSLSSASFQYNDNDYLNESDWKDYSFNTSLTLSKGQRIYFRGSCEGRTDNNYIKFSISGNSKVNAYGNIDSLLDSSSFAELQLAPAYAFYRLFHNCTLLSQAPDLPATQVSSYSYRGLFANCTSLTKPPILRSNAAYGSHMEMFYGSGLKTPPKLPSNLAQYCFKQMFSGSGIATAPELPSVTNTAINCYQQMFEGCGSLKAPPVIPSTNIAANSCYQMFRGSGITTIPDLSGKNIGDYGCYGMFDKCTSLTDLNDFTIEDSGNSYSLYKMFYSCTSLIKAPKIIASVVGSYGLSAMFSNCTSLSDVPEMNIQVVGSHGCEYMFSGCSSLSEIDTILPDCISVGQCGCKNMFSSSSVETIDAILPSCSSIGEEGCAWMFSGCLELKTVNRLLPNCNSIESYGCERMFAYCHNLSEILTDLVTPNLGSYCYSYMFEECKSITYAPILYATEIPSGGYAHMFYNCENLKHVYIYANSVNTSKLDGWLDRCADQGEIVCDNNDVSLATDSTSGIPHYWSTLYIGDWSSRPCCFSAGLDVGESLNVKLDKVGTSESFTASYWYSYDLVRWYPLKLSSTMLTLTRDQNSINFRGTHSQQDQNNYIKFNVTGSGKFNLCGNLISLVYSTKDVTSIKGKTSIRDTGAYTFYKLFYGCKTLNSYDTEVLSYTTELAPYCYAYLFSGSSITSGAELPATYVFDYSYYYMFYQCYDLETCPDISKIEIVDYHSMDNMFCGCSRITECPNFAPKTVWNSWYSDPTGAVQPIYSCYKMFMNCTSLEDASGIIIKDIDYSHHSGYAFSHMFYGCTSLISPPDLSDSTLSNWCYSYMFYRCTSLAAPPDLPSTVTVNGCYYHMFDGCTSLTESPVLNAESLVSSSCAHMFNGCSSLSKVTCHSTSKTSDATTNWLNNVASNGKFYSANISSTLWPIGPDGIPAGWRHCINDKEYLYFESVLSTDETNVTVTPGSTSYPLYDPESKTLHKLSSTNDYAKLLAAEGTSQFEIYYASNKSNSFLRDASVLHVSKITSGVPYISSSASSTVTIYSIKYRINVKDLGKIYTLSEFNSFSIAEKASITSIQSNIQWASSFKYITTSDSGVTNMYTPDYYSKRDSFTYNISSTPESVSSSELFSRVWLYNYENGEVLDSSVLNYKSFKISCVAYKNKPEIYFSKHLYFPVTLNGLSIGTDYLFPDGKSTDRPFISAYFKVKDTNKWYDLPSSSENTIERNFMMNTLLSSSDYLRIEMK